MPCRARRETLYGAQGGCSRHKVVRRFAPPQPMNRIRYGHPYAKTYGHNAEHPHDLSCSVQCEPDQAIARGAPSLPIRKPRGLRATRMIMRTLTPFASPRYACFCRWITTRDMLRFESVHIFIDYTVEGGAGIKLPASRGLCVTLCLQLHPPPPLLVWNSTATTCATYGCTEGLVSDEDAADTECEDSECTDDLCCTGEQLVSMDMPASCLVL